MPACVVKWCRSHTDLKKESGVSFHIFPRREPRRGKWIEAVRLERREYDWMPSKISLICSIHFANEDFYMSKKGCTMLNKRAVPICTMVFSNDISASSLRANAAEYVKLWKHNKERNTESSPEATISKGSFTLASEDVNSRIKSEDDSSNEHVVIFSEPRPFIQVSDCNYGVDGGSSKRKLVQCPNCQCKFDVYFSDEEENAIKIMKIEDIKTEKD